MSGSTSTEQHQDSAQQPSSMDDSGMDVDPALLRARALSTLKKPKVTAPKGVDSAPKPLRRPAAYDYSIQLNYGTEEPSLGAFSVASSVAGPSSAARSSPPPSTSSMDVDDEQTREEGEISDSEAGPSIKRASTPPKAVPAKPQPTILNLPMKPTSSPLVASSSLPKAETKGHSTPEISSRDMNTSALPLRHFTPSEHEVDIPDDFQVRPGLRMTEDQYNTAKDLILDLLGWGVPPEYFVEYGLSREILYFVFLELNLRLPTNLDVSGLPPPPSPRTVRYSSPEPISPPVPTFNRPRSLSAAVVRQAQGHPSLPQKPRTSQGTPIGEGVLFSATAAPFIPVPGNSMTQETPNTIDIELQRKQELLARKAVLASRKSKQTAVPTPGFSTHSTLEARLSDPKLSDAASTVPKQAVDDFLKSIGSIDSPAPTPLNQDNDMDVDGPIPGLTSTLPTPAWLAPSPQLSEVRSLSASTSGIFPSGPEVNMLSQRPSMDRDMLDRSQSRSDEKSDFSEPQTREPSLGPKRGTKRPVASDFVDADPGPSRSYYSGYRDYYSGHSYPSRARPQSFAGIPTLRRMVIHLSDTSDDEDDEDAPPCEASQSHAPRRPQLPTYIATTTSSPIVGTPNQAITPAALQEKEEEIKRMKEKIAQRERARMEKLAAASKASTPPVTVISENPKQVPITVKQEDDDTTVPTSLTYTTTPSTTTKNETNSDVGQSVTSVRAQSSSSSSASPPTDAVPQPLIHQSIGNEVLTAEAQQEDVATAPTPTIQNGATVGISHSPIHHVNVDDGHSTIENPSTQEPEVSTSSQPSNQFVAYSSPLSSYPLLHASLPQHLIGTISTTTDPYAMFPNSSTPERPDSKDPHVLAGVNLKAIKAIAMHRWLSDPFRRLCQYEVPGGGECRDRNCEDIHPSFAHKVEPSDEETARHLYARLPKSSVVTLEQLQTALQEAQHPDTGYHTRVHNALEKLGLRAQP
ncbi:hypothetical protein BDY19DRAFT_969328 [Irpex rosettiformis]|uniref:Uncharacterized protein n=1 Tax=Irpex rosettiformis TaxID=378272 RepID=A0ACB8TS73_9APHY|nr:hypothetical protein BDY19DRAFT_969328 [Irpex rosettiformis]